VRILFVCTGNHCRSPFAERLATDWARTMLAGSPEALDIHVESAGLAATAGQEMDLHTAAALRRHGIASDSGVLVAWWVPLTACGRIRWICVSGSSPQSMAG
jgi:protein-tyrosine-phosphatase